MKKDKVKVLDEVLTDDRIKEFLELEAPLSENTDFHRLVKAYRGMPPQYFDRFLTFFIEIKGDINAPSTKGDTILSIAKSHSQSQDYIDLLLAKGAK